MNSVSSLKKLRTYRKVIGNSQLANNTHEPDRLEVTGWVREFICGGLWAPFTFSLDVLDQGELA